MAGLLDFASDLNKEENGVWCQLGDMSFLIARAGNERWKKRNRMLENQAYGSMGRRKDKRSPEKDTEILINCLAYTCVLDWKNVRFKADGDEIPFSHEKAFEILADKRFKELTDEILGIALDAERFMEEQIEEDEKK
jgi:hypothetical protein